MISKAYRILVTGASGFLGWNLASELTAAGFEVTGTWHRCPPDRSAAVRWLQLNLEMIEAGFDTILNDIDVFVHCAAIASRAACDADAVAARRVNTVAAIELAARCAKNDVPFIHISTDLVFDGCHGNYQEDATVSPLSVYGASKAAAEEAILSVHSHAFILRAALMYGLASFNVEGAMLAWTLASLRERRPLHLYTNQFRSLLYAPDLARVICAIVDGRLPPGIAHVGGPERWSRYDAGCRIAEVYGMSADGITAAVLKREPPLTFTDDCTLDCARVKKYTGISFTPLNEGLMYIQMRLNSAGANR